MNFFLSIALFSLSVSAFANCETEARNTAEEAVRLFSVNDQDVHCKAAGVLESFESLPVITVMPPRYSYKATFDYRCGPQPRNPKVTLLLNEQCKIVTLKLSGFQLK